jgi:uncharacterized membrane protein
MRSATVFLATLLVGTGLSLGLGVAPSFAATGGSTAASQIGTGVHASPSAMTVETSINPYGCGALATLGYKQMFVAAFAIGYCPSVFSLQGTSWGRAFVNWIDNGLCRIPWAATGGRFTSC